MFLIDCMMNSLALGRNLGKERLFMRVLDERIADLAVDVNDWAVLCDVVVAVVD